MIYNHLNVGNKNTIDNKALAKYVGEVIQSKYKDIPNADIFLKKASIIGEQFVCDILEAPNGFGYDAASTYLEKMNEMHGFIRNCINIENQYEFVYSEIYQSIFNSISSENKISWFKILIQYYECQYEHFSHINISPIPAVWGAGCKSSAYPLRSAPSRPVPCRFSGRQRLPLRCSQEADTGAYFFC